MNAPSPSSPWLLGLVTATLAFLVAATWFFRIRLEGIESRLGSPAADAPARPERGPGRDAPRPETGGAAAGEEADLARKLGKLSEDSYEYYTDLAQDLHEAKRTLKQLNAAVRRLQQQMAEPGMPSGAWALAADGQPLTPEVLAAYRKDAEGWRVVVKEGRVEVRGILNLSPWTTMPIEFFVTRWPESGHETLLHVLGPAVLDETLTPDRLRGLITAVYKGMIAAGFAQGEGASFEPPADEKARPRWIPPTGDVVYVGVRYLLGGQVHLARATDWVIDPATKSVLPADAFRFTGSRRGEDYETGDEQLTAEASGLLASVYFNPNALIEIALPSNLDNDYQYNHVRIPKPAILRLEQGAGRLDAVRDRARRALRLLDVERDGKRFPLTGTPALLVRGPDGEEVAKPFARVGEGWEVVDDALAKGDWRVRVEVDGAARETEGFDPFYVDLILSKTPIVPEGDGATPLEPIVLPEDLPTGTGPRK